MYKIVRFLMIALVLLTVAIACGPAPTQPPNHPTTQPPNEPVAFPLTITDDLGRDVTVETRPQRIISLAPSNTEILFAIGAGDQVVGVTTYCNYPPEAQDREQIGGFSAKTISVEKIVALEPDLVFSVGEIQRPAIEALEQVGITVVALDPNDFDEVYATIELMGRLTGHEKEAAQIVADMKARVAAVQERIATIPEEERLTVFWETYDEPLMTVGTASFTHQLIELAGGVNIFADLSETYPQVNAEEVIKRNPAVIMGAHVTIIDISADRLRYLDEVLHGRFTTLSSNPHNVADSVRHADAVIGGVLVPGAKAPRLVTKEMVKTMVPGSVIVDVAIDQGGCIETVRPTSHSDPVFVVDGVIHYCVTNMPGAVPRTSTYALSNATLPYAVKLANLGFVEAVKSDGPLAKGVNTYAGHVTCDGVATAHGLECKLLDELI